MSSMTTPPDPRLPLPEFVRRARSIARELTLLFVGTTMLLLLQPDRMDEGGIRFAARQRFDEMTL